jgi:outer membrane protein TolC
MNNRAALVDQWRLIQFNAMSLLTGLDIVVDGDISTVGNDPTRFRSATGAMSAGVRIDPPLTRLIERNNFRQAILDYQQVRRQQIQYEDRIKLSIRQSLRQFELDQRNLETQRRAVIIAIRRVDQTRLTLSQPAPPPPLPGPDGIVTADPVAGQLGPTATLNLIYAFNDLRSSQDALTSIWINYYATRASLAQQLGVMDLTDDGLWVDKPFMLADRATEEQMPLPPQVPQEWLDHLEDVDAPPPLPAGVALPEPGAPARLPDVRARALRAAEKDAPSAEGTGAPAEAEDARSWTLRLPGFGGKSD